MQQAKKYVRKLQIINSEADGMGFSRTSGSSLLDSPDRSLSVSSFCSSHPAVSLIHTYGSPTWASPHPGPVAPWVILYCILNAMCPQPASECSDCCLHQTCSPAVGDGWAVPTQVLKGRHHCSSENVSPEDQPETLALTLCVFYKYCKHSCL